MEESEVEGRCDDRGAVCGSLTSTMNGNGEHRRFYAHSRMAHTGSVHPVAVACQLSASVRRASLRSLHVGAVHVPKLSRSLRRRRGALTHEQQ